MDAQDETPSLALAFEQYRRLVAAGMATGAVPSGVGGVLGVEATPRPQEAQDGLEGGE